MRNTYENTGTLTLNGKDYRLDTYYPMGKSRPAYKMFHVWSREGESLTFASEEGFEQWLEKVQAHAPGRNLPLFHL